MTAADLKPGDRFVWFKGIETVWDVVPSGDLVRVELCSGGFDLIHSARSITIVR